MRGPFRTVIVIALLCAATGIALAGKKDKDADDSKWVFRTAKSECGIVQYPKDWAKANVKAMVWSGKCPKKGRALAKGDGVLTVKLKDGGVIIYKGTMEEGAFATGEETLDDGTRFVGVFRPWRNSREGKRYRPDGSLEFDGEIQPSEMGVGFFDGLYYAPDGESVADGRYDPAAPAIDLVTGAGVEHAIVYGRDSKPIRWLSSGKSIPRAEYEQFAEMWAQFDQSTDEFNDWADQNHQESIESRKERRQQRKAASDKSSSYLWGAFGAALGGASTGRTGAEQLQNANAALTDYSKLSVDEGAKLGFSGAMDQATGGTGGVPGLPGSGATGGATGGVKGGMGGTPAAKTTSGAAWNGRGGIATTSPTVVELRRGAVKLDPASNDSDVSKCVKGVVEYTGRKDLVNGVYEDEVWLLLVNECGFDVYVVYCFEINGSGYPSCATGYPGTSWREDGTFGFVSDQYRRVNLKFGGYRTLLQNPNQRLHMGACRYIPRTPGDNRSGNRVRVEHRYDATGFTIRCTRS